LSDDVGYGDSGAYGHPYANTPNINKLAAEGTLFRHFYATGAVCNPSRTGFMTGRNPNSFPNYSDDYGFLGAATITELLTETHEIGHFGKWHIGPEKTAKIGTYGIDAIRTNGGAPDDPRGKDAPVFDNAINFIKRNKDKPFYLNVWGRAGHKPVRPSKILIEKSGLADLVVDRNKFGEHMQEKFDTAGKGGKDLGKHMANYLADIYGVDALIGELLQTVDDLGLRNNTIIVWSSDQGPAPAGSKTDELRNMLGYAGGLRGGKGTIYEGGVRIPFIVRWPGMVPAGKINEHSIMSALDWLPTLCSISGVSYNEDLFEGEDLSDIWLGSDRSRVNPMYWARGRNNAIVYDKWKLFYFPDKDVSELYDLEVDPGEFNDVSGDNVEVTNALLERLKQAISVNYGKQKRSGKPAFFDPTKPLPKIRPPNFEL